MNLLRPDAGTDAVEFLCGELGEVQRRLQQQPCAARRGRLDQRNLCAARRDNRRQQQGGEKGE